VLPLQFAPGESASGLGLTGRETYTIERIAGADPIPRELTVRADSGAHAPLEFRVIVRIDTPKEQQYFQHGGILQYVLRSLLG
jgi:aconitate hydratase